MARQMHPAQKNSLDALCRRYEIDNSQRTLHGALLDAEILADVYLAMTGGQRALSLGGDEASREEAVAIRRLDPERPRLRVIPADARETERHERTLAMIDEVSQGRCLWLRQGEDAT